MAAQWLQLKGELIDWIFLYRPSRSGSVSGCTIIHLLIFNALRTKTAVFQHELHDNTSLLRIDDDVVDSFPKYLRSVDAPVCNIKISVNRDSGICRTLSTETENYKKTKILFYNQMTSRRRDESGLVALFT